MTEYLSVKLFLTVNSTISKSPWLLARLLQNISSLGTDKYTRLNTDLTELRVLKKIIKMEKLQLVKLGFIKTNSKEKFTRGQFS